MGSINAITQTPVTFNGSIPFLETLYHSTAIKTFEILKLTGLPAELLNDKIVVFSLSRSRIYKNAYYRSGVSERGRQVDIQKLEILDNFLVRLIETIVNGNSILILVDDLPYNCSEREIRREPFAEDRVCFVDKIASVSDRKPLTGIYKVLAKKNQAVYYLDPKEDLCFEEDCLVFKNGVPIYADRSPHFSSSSEKILSEFFRLKFETFGYR